jgi:uncharacterized membrane protein
MSTRAVVTPVRRLLVCAALGLALALLVALAEPWQFAILAGWNGALAAFVVWLWWRVRRMDAEATRAAAMSNDFSHLVGDALLLAASVLNLPVVGFALVEGSRRSVVVAGIVNGLGVLAVGLSWAVVHTVFALRYADLYYTGGGGIDFGASEPDYGDFAYLAFTLGMTYQVSDTPLTSSRLRAAALRHALLSYLFGAVILATTINVVAGLFRG